MTGITAQQAMATGQAVPEALISRFDTGDNEAIFDWIHEKIVRFTKGRCYPSEDQVYFAEEFCRLVNLKYGHDGHWQVIWTAPHMQPKHDRYNGIFRAAWPQVIMVRWINPGGQTVFEIVFDQFTFDQILDYGISNCVKQCEIAWQTWDRAIAQEALRGDADMIDPALEGPTAMSGNLQNRLKKAEKNGKK